MGDNEGEKKRPMTQEEEEEYILRVFSKRARGLRDEVQQKLDEHLNRQQRTGE